MTQHTTSTQELLQQVKQAAGSGQISSTAAANIVAWLTEPRYAEYADEVAAHIAEEKWQILDDVFWTVIPFGTGGRRGRMYPIGSNAINDRTIGESAKDWPTTCAIRWGRACRYRARLPTTRGIGPSILPGCAPKL